MCIRDRGSVGGENWCVYAALNPYCATASIMSYGMAWAGSAPGPVSPRSWLEGIYDYAVTAMSPEKIFMGLPGYGWNWQDVYKRQIRKLSPAKRALRTLGQTAVSGTSMFPAMSIHRKPLPVWWRF